jgi:hypothetical protein
VTSCVLSSSSFGNEPISNAQRKYYLSSTVNVWWCDLLKVKDYYFPRYGHQRSGDNQSHRNNVGAQIHADINEYLDRDKNGGSVKR